MGRQQHLPPSTGRWLGRCERVPSSTAAAGTYPKLPRRVPTDVWHGRPGHSWHGGQSGGPREFRCQGRSQEGRVTQRWVVFNESLLFVCAHILMFTVACSLTCHVAYPKDNFQDLFSLFRHVGSRD